MFVSTNKVFKLGPESLCFSPKSWSKALAFSTATAPQAEKAGKMFELDIMQSWFGVRCQCQSKWHLLFTHFIISIHLDFSPESGWQLIKGPTCQISEYDNVYHGQTYPRLLWHFSIKSGSRGWICKQMPGGQGLRRKCKRVNTQGGKHFLALSSAQCSISMHRKCPIPVGNPAV